jgi:hypothetical protein
MCYCNIFQLCSSSTFRLHYMILIHGADWIRYLEVRFPFFYPTYAYFLKITLSLTSLALICPIYSSPVNIILPNLHWVIPLCQFINKNKMKHRQTQHICILHKKYITCATCFSSHQIHHQAQHTRLWNTTPSCTVFKGIVICHYSHFTFLREEFLSILSSKLCLSMSISRATSVTVLFLFFFPRHHSCEQ